MTDDADVQVLNVIPLRTSARVMWETLRDIRASFPGWYVWHSAGSSTWNAHREGREPYFGPVPEGAPVFMVSASNAAQLMVMLEWQTLGDMAREFPAWRVGRTDSGGWYALARGHYGVRLIHGPAAAPLRETVRALIRAGQCDPAKEHTPHLDHST
jgi:hypothetical protein